MKKLNIKIYRNIYNFACWFETWWLTLREQHRLRVFENRVLKRIFGPRRDEVTGSGENHIMRSLMICTAHPKVKVKFRCGAFYSTTAYGLLYS
jgi:hypothetical protein